MRPPKGPHPRYYHPSLYGTDLTALEQGVVMVVKVFSAFIWATVLAKFVGVYNNLEPEVKEFRNSWDALNRFISYFKVSHVDAMELRRFYLERRGMLGAQGRKQVCKRGH